MIEKVIKKVKKKYSALQNKYMNQVYSLDGVEIQLGKNHQLRIYQEQFEFYDRYLPYLSQLCKEDKWGGNRGSGYCISVSAAL